MSRTTWAWNLAVNCRRCLIVCASSGSSQSAFALCTCPVLGAHYKAVDWAQRLAEMKKGARAEASAAVRSVSGRRFRKVDGAWVDQELTASTPVLRLRVLGNAY